MSTLYSSALKTASVLCARHHLTRRLIINLPLSKSDLVCRAFFVMRHPTTCCLVQDDSLLWQLLKRSRTPSVFFFETEMASPRFPHVFPSPVRCISLNEGQEKRRGGRGGRVASSPLFLVGVYKPPPCV